MNKLLISGISVIGLALMPSLALADYTCPSIQEINDHIAQGDINQISTPYGMLILSSGAPSSDQTVVSLNNAQILVKTGSYASITVSCAYNYKTPNELPLIYDVYRDDLNIIFKGIGNNWWVNQSNPNFAVCGINKKELFPSECPFTNSMP